jgi:hypothetical protein
MNTDQARKPVRAKRPRELFPDSARQHNRFEYAAKRFKNANLRSRVIYRLLGENR